MKVWAGVLESLHEEARKASPLECCGVLWRRGEVIEEFSPYRGVLGEHRFRLPDEWLLREYYRGRSQGLKAAGFYHSHPGQAHPEPSALDLAGHPRGALCLIVGEVNCRAFRVSNFAFVETKLEVIC